MIRNIEESTGTACHQNRGNTGLFVQIPCTLQKWCDRFLFPANHLLHELIPQHKVGGRSVLINQEQMCACLQTFNYPGRLGSTSAGIHGREAGGILLIGKIIDKHGNIYISHGSTIFCPKLDSRSICNDKFPAITRNMVIDASLQSFQKGGFSMVSTTDDQSNTFRNCHSRDSSCMVKNKCLFHGSRRAERNGILHRQIRNAAFSRKNCTIFYKCLQMMLLKQCPKLLLIFIEMNGCFQLLRI